MRRATLPAWALAAALLASSACDPAEAPPPDESAGVSVEAFEELPEDVQAELEALGYVITTEIAAGNSGVSVHDEARALAGWNLYVSMHGREALLIDMDGRVLHRWSGPPEPEEERKQRKLGLWWRTVRLFPNGDLLAQTDYGPLMKLDFDSRPIWVYDDTAHHDFDVMPDGRIFAIVGNTAIRHPGFVHPLSEDFVALLSPDGLELGRVSLLAALKKGGQTEALEELRKYQRSATDMDRGDVTHLNAIEILGPPGPGAPEAFASGRLLLSTPKNHRLLLMDFERAEIVWSQRGSFRYQHDPTYTEDGRLLLFDNLGAGEDRSRILAIDPRSGDDLWSYGDPPDPPLFSKCCGRVHPLANGNLLSVVSLEGRALEITPDGTIVWEFRSPHELGGKIAILNDVLRIDPSFFDPEILARLSQPER